ncbi:MAG: GTPase HflX [Myxococcales bacterium]|nr:GTPase HflX [Myxococcales bacterium]
MELHGNTKGLSPSAERTLLRLYRRRVPIEHLATPELVRSLVDASIDTGRQVGVLVHRSGQVDTVIVGDAGKLMLPDIGRLRAAEGRFRALRLIHTHVRGEPLTHDDLVDLVRLRLDVVCAVQMAPRGEPRGFVYAHNVADEPPYRIVGPLPIARIGELHVGQLMASLEADFAKRIRSREVRGKDGRAILVQVYKKDDRNIHPEESLRELHELARTAGVEVVDAIVQARESIDPKFVLGIGKLEDVVMRAMELDAETLVFDRNLSPAQAAAISAMSDLKVIDRTQLILDIFAQRAESKDGKLQVELAQLKYAMPRLSLKDDSLSRLTGGIGGRGPGETKLEIGRRRAKERVSHLEGELRKLARQRTERRKKRGRDAVPTVAIVGYTNAGKSTLLRALTGADTLIEDKLFATLDTRSRTIRVGWAGYGEREVVVTDTVGFIRDLPKDLFSAFRATFEEAEGADLLLHVVDASDPARDEHMLTTDALLEELGVGDVPRILVFNKVDRLESTERLLLAGAATRARAPVKAEAVVQVSARDRTTTRPLVEAIATALRERWENAAKPPPARDDLPVREMLPWETQAPESADTLDALLLAAGRRRKHAP